MERDNKRKYKEYYYNNDESIHEHDDVLNMMNTQYQSYWNQFLNAEKRLINAIKVYDQLSKEKDKVFMFNPNSVEEQRTKNITAMILLEKTSPTYYQIIKAYIEYDMLRILFDKLKKIIKQGNQAKDNQERIHFMKVFRGAIINYNKRVKVYNEKESEINKNGYDIVFKLKRFYIAQKTEDFTNGEDEREEQLFNDTLEKYKEKK